MTKTQKNDKIMFQCQLISDSFAHFADGRCGGHGRGQFSANHGRDQGAAESTAGHCEFFTWPHRTNFIIANFVESLPKFGSFMLSGGAQASKSQRNILGGFHFKRRQEDSFLFAGCKIVQHWKSEGSDGLHRAHAGTIRGGIGPDGQYILHHPDATNSQQR